MLEEQLDGEADRRHLSHAHRLSKSGTRRRKEPMDHTSSPPLLLLRGDIKTEEQSCSGEGDEAEGQGNHSAKQGLPRLNDKPGALHGTAVPSEAKGAFGHFQGHAGSFQPSLGISP